MIRFVIRAIVRFLLLGAVLWGVGQLVARRFSEGDAASDEFALAAIFGGAERTSTATALRTGHVKAVCGGIQLDLREASLDPAGADLTVEATMGGVQVLVPADWRVTVDADAKAGGVDVRVQADGLPADAPALRVEAVALMGGIQVTTEESGGEAPPR